MGQTAAQRQAKCRKQRDLAGPEGNGQRRLSTWVDTGTHLALQRLARKEKTTLRAVLERLIAAADDGNLAGVEPDSPAWDVYFNVK
jgi:hypothetical protein